MSAGQYKPPIPYPLYWFCRLIVSLFFHSLFRIEIIGSEKIPDGSVILASNHINNLDPPLLGITTKRHLMFMAKAELFKYPILSWGLKLLGGFPVRRGENDKNAMRYAIQILQQGACLVIFPEGHRSMSGRLGKPMPGVGLIAKRSEAAIVPIAISGKYKIFHKITVRYGDPIFIEPSQSSQEIANKIMENISELLEK
ncbi:lysophospholipid acyltransferase family protein [Alicyclobacillus tolerans]|uniref:1-acyl-sn-glycerol-3-phosphate acyltransferase n=1 Tax=Alicyclobacillus tolerans TaxID=90970 RepID=A0ABT9M024_9BACL|nr:MULTISPECIES: lysophospholipid acyltransferase family protein [Alicyclobacillus]MDP9729841.1 1-acyl-sn-glycerol-3-phosphate acyltransferase [Alicyclobacillus tengchongensis]